MAGVLVKADGSVLWRNPQRAAGPEKRSLSEYIDKPDVALQNFIAAGRTGVAELVKTLREGGP